MNEFIGYIHVAYIEDTYYLLGEESVTTRSSGLHPHYVMVNVMCKNDEHKAKIKETLKCLLAPAEKLSQGEQDEKGMEG